MTSPPRSSRVRVLASRSRRVHSVRAPLPCTPVDSSADSRSLLDVSRARLSSLLIALLVVLGGSAWAAEFVPPIAFATSHDGATHANALTASRHVEVGVVARTLRT